MATLIEAIKNATRTAYCSGLSTLEKTSLLVGKMPSLTFPANVLNQAINQSEVINCNKNPANVVAATVPPPFQGGQCSGSNQDYTVSFTATDANNGDYSQQTRLVKGKVGVPYFSGTQICVPSSSSAPVCAEMGLGQLPNATVVKIRVDQVTPYNFVTDNCGNLPSSAPPPVSSIRKALGDLNYIDALGNAVSFGSRNIDFFQPCVNIDGIRIPFEIDLGSGKICGKVGISPDLMTGAEPNVDIDICPDQKQDLASLLPSEIPKFFDLSGWVGNGSSTPEAGYGGAQNTSFDTDFPPILGVFVSAQKDGISQRTTTLIKENSEQFPNLILPRIGSLRFEYLIKKESGYETSFSADIDIKQVEQFIPCPWEFGAISIEIKWAKGWRGQYKTASRHICCEACAAAETPLDENGNPTNPLSMIDRCRID